MDLNLFGKNALVCGGSKGIGKAAAIELANLGANITIVARSAELMSELSVALPRNGGQDHDWLVADFTQVDDLKRKIKVTAASKVYHILINNTGGPKGGLITNAQTEEFLQAFNNHLICNHIITTEVIKGMKRAGYGRIINVISTSVKAPIDGLGVSNTTRGAVASWGKTMANELASYGITVNNILPGATSTGRLAEVISANAKQKGISEEAMAKMWEDGIPMKRFARPEELGAVIAFLASPAASYVTGVNLPVDGGRTRSM